MSSVAEISSPPAKKRKLTSFGRESTTFEYLSLRKDIRELEKALEKARAKKKRMEADHPFLGTVRGVFKEKPEKPVTSGEGTSSGTAPPSTPKRRRLPKGVDPKDAVALTPEQREQYRAGKDITNRVNLCKKSGKPPSDKLRKDYSEALRKGITFGLEISSFFASSVGVGNPSELQVRGMGGEGMDWVPLVIQRPDGTLDIRGTTTQAAGESIFPTN